MRVWSSLSEYHSTRCYQNQDTELWHLTSDLWTALRSFRRCNHLLASHQMSSSAVIWCELERKDY